MDRSLEKLLDSLLYEGYALYPYTPGATKNATPTPFGIVYPPAYAGRSDATYDLLRMECVVETAGDAVLRGEVRFLQAEGERHKGVERRVEIPATGVADARGGGHRTRVRLRCGRPARGPGADARHHARQRVDADRRLRPQHDPGRGRPGDRPHERAERQLDLHAYGRRDRGRALHLPARARGSRRRGGRRVSQSSTRGRCSRAPATTRSWARRSILPDHPSMAPESLGNLFDSTEIEEALLLHVHALSDDERGSDRRAGPRGEGDGRASAGRRGARTSYSLHGQARRRSLTSPGIRCPASRRSRSTALRSARAAR